MPPSTDNAQRHPAPPQVETRGRVRTLQFSQGNIQSEMRVDRPDQLVLAYSRAMMLFALFQPRPRHILMVGLGGGSLLKFCHRHLPHTRITVVELRADVIALRSQFAIPPDDARLQVVHADASSHIRSLHEQVDVLMVDGFDAAGLPPALGSLRFYADCRRALRPDGVLVANLFSYDANYRAMLQRLQFVFERQLAWFDGVAGNNRIIFCVNPAPGAGPAGRMLRRVARCKGLGLPILNRLLARATVLWLARHGGDGRSLLKRT